MAPKVSIIIVALNEAENLERTLGAIRAMNCSPEDYEVLVVDGGSSDATPRVAEHAGVRLVKADGKNIPASRNIGVANARASIVAFLDADCLVHPEWLRRGLKYFEAGQDALVGSPAGLPAGTTWVQRFWADHWKVKTAAALGKSGKKETFRVLTTRNLFTTRRVVHAVGGFDEKQNTGEDYWFCYKAQSMGFPLYCDFDVSVVHLGEPATLRDFYYEQVWHASNGVSARLLWHEARFRRGQPAGWNAVIFGLYTAVALYLSLLGIIQVLAGSGWSLLAGGLALLVSGPAALAVRTAYKTGHWSRIPGYTLLYAIYGLARVAACCPGLQVSRKRKKGAGV